MVVVVEAVTRRHGDSSSSSSSKLLCMSLQLSISYCQLCLADRIDMLVPLAHTIVAVVAISLHNKIHFFSHSV
jgi:hypothetical protein